MRHLLLSLIVVIAAPLHAETEPARIGSHPDSLANRIRFPDVDGDFTLFVRCEAKVLPAGAVDEVGCYADEKVDDAFYRAIYLAATSATFTPASLDGERASVLALFSVVFRQQGEDRVVAVVPNHGTNAQRFGVNYIAPQRFGRNNQFTPRTELGLLWIDATITATGKAEQIEYIDTEWTNRETRRFAKSYISNNRFIPGFVDGKPTAMRFVKPIFGYRNGFMVAAIQDRCGDAIIACDETSSATGRPRFVFDD